MMQNSANGENHSYMGVLSPLGAAHSHTRPGSDTKVWVSDPQGANECPCGVNHAMVVCQMESHGRSVFRERRFTRLTRMLDGRLLRTGKGG
jgi:hypothetical protein